jgi:hypothetical protein
MTSAISITVRISPVEVAPHIRVVTLKLHVVGSV